MNPQMNPQASDSHYKIDIEFDEKTTVSIGNYPINEMTKVVKMSRQQLPITEVRCAFGNGESANIKVTSGSRASLRTNILMDIDESSLRLQGSFTREDSMFCVLVGSPSSYQSFSLYYKKELSVIADQMAVDASPSKFVHVKCGSTKIKGSVDCKSVVYIFVKMFINHKHRMLSRVTFRIMANHLFIGESYPQLWTQLIEHARHFSVDGSLKIDSFGGDNPKTLEFKSNGIQYATTVERSPVVSQDQSLIFTIPTHFYRIHVHWIRLRIMLRFFHRDYCGKLKLYTCDVFCLSSASDCLFFDESDVDVHGAIRIPENSLTQPSPSSPILSTASTPESTPSINGKLVEISASTSTSNVISKKV